MVFFFSRLCNRLKTRKRDLKAQRGYEWINIKVSLFGQVAKKRNASIISNHAYSPYMHNKRIKLNI